MTPPTVWPARRVGDRILCGRRVAERYVCQGELVRVDHWSPRALRPPGTVWEYGDDGLDHLRLSARAERQAAAGRRPVGHGGTANGEGVDTRGRGSQFPEAAYIARRFTIRCPHCRCVNLVEYPLPSPSRESTLSPSE